MSIIFAGYQTSKEKSYVYWRCENCLVTSEPIVWEGRFSAAREAQKELDKHVLAEHDGYIFADAKTNVRDVQGGKRSQPKKSGKIKLRMARH